MRNGTELPVPDLTEIPTIQDSAVRIRQRYSRFGKLVVINSGKVGRGFRICPWCGFADQAPEPEKSTGRQKRKEAPHRNPRTQRECAGPLMTRHLGHEFLTDVIEWRFGGFIQEAANIRMWRSVVYALLEGRV